MGKLFREDTHAALNPIPAVFVVVMAYIVQALIIGSGEVAVSFPTFDTPEAGNIFEDIIGGITNAIELIGDIILFLAQFLAFQPVGMPWFIGVPIAVATSGVILWGGFELARGT